MMQTTYVMSTWMSISTVVANVYDTSIFIVNTLSTTFFIAFVIVNFPAAIALNKLGLNFTFKLSAACMIIGLWLRYLMIMLIHD